VRFTRPEHVVWREDKEGILNVSLGKYPFRRQIKRWKPNIKMDCMAGFNVSGVEAWDSADTGAVRF
jgi:hypothetical protein